MPFQPEAISVDTLKKMAKRLKAAIADELGTAPSHQRVQVILARTLGHASWEAATASNQPIVRSLAPAVTLPDPPAPMQPVWVGMDLELKLPQLNRRQAHAVLVLTALALAAEMREEPTWQMFGDVFRQVEEAKLLRCWERLSEPMRRGAMNLSEAIRRLLLAHNPMYAGDLEDYTQLGSFADAVNRLLQVMEPPSRLRVWHRPHEGAALLKRLGAYVESGISIQEAMTHIHRRRATPLSAFLLDKMIRGYSIYHGLLLTRDLPPGLAMGMVALDQSAQRLPMPVAMAILERAGWLA